MPRKKDRWQQRCGYASAVAEVLLVVVAYLSGAILVGWAAGRFLGRLATFGTAIGMGWLTWELLTSDDLYEGEGFIESIAVLVVLLTTFGAGRVGVFVREKPFCD
jgi:hypothetical protein